MDIWNVVGISNLGTKKLGISNNCYQIFDCRMKQVGVKGFVLNDLLNFKKGLKMNYFLSLPCIKSRHNGKISQSRQEALIS